ncbi:hypothetical protein TPE_2649 [Treponema pedis str. T A4]|uniref:Uncharacterized protein n=1 Tax=Treponema pedis str. T A4 TaxID=1291379 RepID=S6A572_9SPIR|nr:hypothetical protein TPE_2649 [Treponema pedis str. T A4]
MKKAVKRDYFTAFLLHTAQAFLFFSYRYANITYGTLYIA